MPKEFYRYSFETAQSLGQEKEYFESENENRRCRDYFTDEKQGLYATAYENYVVDKDNAFTKKVMKEFGIERTMFILATTVRSLQHDGRIDNSIKEWAKTFNAGLRVHEPTTNCMITQLNPGIIDILAKDALEEYAELKLFSQEHCFDKTHDVLEDKVIVLSPKALKEEYWSPENQLWLATGGFGCYPDKSGRAVYATCLSDGEQTRWNREDVIGVIKDEYMPEWAMEKLEELKAPEVEEKQDMDMKM